MLIKKTFLSFLLILCVAMAAEAQSASDKKNKIYHSADEEASFPGGNEAFTKFANENIVYPMTALNDKVFGKVVIEIIVEKDGKISSIKIKRGIRQDIDDEALRLIKSMPPWVPGKNKGQPIRMRKLIPIKFKLP